MDVQLKLKEVNAVIINKHIKCRDCDTFMVIGSIGYSVKYRGQTVGHTRLVCGCVDIPCKWVINLKGVDELNKVSAVEQS